MDFIASVSCIELFLRHLYENIVVNFLWFNWWLFLRILLTLNNLVNVHGGLRNIILYMLNWVHHYGVSPTSNIWAAIWVETDLVVLSKSVLRQILIILTQWLLLYIDLTWVCSLTVILWIRWWERSSLKMVIILLFVSDGGNVSSSTRGVNAVATVLARAKSWRFWHWGWNRASETLGSNWW